MGTRCLTFVYDGDITSTPIINLYRQYDGYPEGHGAELARFLGRGKLVNGLRGDNAPSFNGMGCLAAQLVARFKDGPGGFYLEPITALDCGQDYEYHVYERDNQIRVAIRDRGCNMFGLTMSDKNQCLFDGDLADFNEYCEEAEAGWA